MLAHWARYEARLVAYQDRLSGEKLLTATVVAITASLCPTHGVGSPQHPHTPHPVCGKAGTNP